MIRVLCFAGALAGGVSLSQFPEFSQQYLQRLGGQVDALTIVAKDFDASALESGLGREEALQQLTGTQFSEDHQADMRRTFARQARLSENLAILRAASPMERLTMPHRMADTEVLHEVWADFAPAVPVTAAGAVAAGTGLLGGWAMMAAFLGMMMLPFRKRQTRTKPEPKKRAEPAVRQEPSVVHSGPTLVATPPSHVPRLMGAER